jgi:hypothetical protein
MPSLEQQPINPNQLTQNRFRFVLDRAPTVKYFMANTELPGMTLEVANQATMFNSIPRPGNKMTFESYPVTFRVDEDLTNYLEIYEWMVSLGFPSDFTGYQGLKAKNIKEVSDGSLMLLSSASNPNINIRFLDMFPISISRLPFDLNNSDIEYTSATVVFAYQRFVIERLGVPVG